MIGTAALSPPSDGGPASVPAPSAGASATVWRVLVQLKNPVLADIVVGVLRGEGMEVRLAARAEDVLATATVLDPDVVILNAGILDADPIAVLAKIRRARQVPALLVTGPGEHDRRLPGVTAGGDDYLRRPFSAEDLAARVRDLLRGVGGQAPRLPSTYRVGDLELDEITREVRRGDQELHLSITEFDLLRLLMRNPRRVMSKAQIADRVWHYDYTVNPKTLDLYIHYLRRKVDADRTP
ncbi:response regulator transcription factor [Litorihabitans aurantiacus]|uniref:response regulator transcription factor n=1 Tax=Litorihabitans aurantiacus TaxID=1930061 RepID=UPI0024E053DA|nr:response regulator transcription factor [Litorihabitans aurantiacus]